MVGSRELSLVRQVMAAMIQDRPFSPDLPSSPLFSGWTSDSVIGVLGAVPRFFFLSPRSFGRQRLTSRHRSPLRQSNLRLEPRGARLKDQSKSLLGVTKALEFYSWVESSGGFVHDERTCREMACLLARANSLRSLWRFLSSNEPILLAKTLTAVIKTLGEEGLAMEALHCFYRMKQLHCKPDVQTLNVVISALCRVGYLVKARAFLARMELPGARYPPDSYTYTILISSYCKRARETGCRKAVRRRIWEANNMFRRMLFVGLVPDVVAYNCLIDGLCKTYRIGRALELFDDMTQRGVFPNRVTYNSFIRYFSVVNEVDKAIEMMRDMGLKGHDRPTTSSYTPVIHALCEGGRAREAGVFLREMVEEGFIPREYTYKMVVQALADAGEEMLPVDVCRRVDAGVECRLRHAVLAKPLLGRVLLYKDDF
ncbi:pentatricopeptide repeat (PPR) superfamily protein [Wolffia australiana]